MVVRDNGPGIPQDILGRLFDPLFTTAQDGEGMGLGLPIVQNLLSQCNGSIVVKNHKEGGAVFVVNLQMAEH